MTSEQKQQQKRYYQSLADDQIISRQKEGAKMNETGLRLITRRRSIGKRMTRIIAMGNSFQRIL